MASLVDLASVKDYLRIPTADTTRDSVLNKIMSAATPVIEKYAGPCAQRTITNERHSGGRGDRTIVALRYIPLISLDSVVEWIGQTPKTVTVVTTLDLATADSCIVNLASGIVERRSGQAYATPWLPGDSNLVFAYTAGYATLPDNVFAGTMEFIRHNFQGTQQPGGRVGRDEAVTPVGPGYSIPNRVIEWLTPNRPLGGIA